MTSISRRNFLKTATGAVAAGTILKNAPTLRANPLDLPLGLQLYSVRNQISKDYDGTLQQVAAAGYKEVESAGYFARSAADVKKSADKAGVNFVSAHYPLAELQPHVDEILVFSKALGVQYIICSSPLMNPARAKASGDFKNVAANINMDDWKWNAEQFNHIGEKVTAAGMRFGYHNHTMEFREEKDVVPFEELLRLTDPKHVVIEMDCGWVAVAGRDPAEYLKRYPDRIAMLHIKDFKLNGPATVLNPPPSTELGRGNIDYHKIFAAAKQGNIKHYFIEQEEFDMPPFEALKIDADYIHNLKV